MRVRLWADIRLIYSCARAFGKTRRRALLLVLDSLWHGGGANPLALVTEAVERQDWRSAAAQLRSWNVAFDWESDAALQRSELINPKPLESRAKLIAVKAQPGVAGQDDLRAHPRNSACGDHQHSRLR
jgi:hypothetical protein